MNDFATGAAGAVGGTNKDGKETTTVVGASEEDGLPFACLLCRKHFTEPVVTTCGHFFCEGCIMNHVQTVSANCPVCSKDTFSVFNQPTKLMAKKRKVCGSRAASWQEYYKACGGGDGDGGDGGTEEAAQDETIPKDNKTGSSERGFKQILME
jgi:hypothetical protein